MAAAPQAATTVSRVSRGNSSILTGLLRFGGWVLNLVIALGRGIWAWITSDWANQNGLIRRAGRCLVRLAVWASVHIGVGWFLFKTATGLNLLGLAFAVLVLLWMVASAISAIAGKKAAKATGDFNTSILSSWWVFECNYLRWAVGLKPMKKEKEKEDEESDSGAH